MTGIIEYYARLAYFETYLRTIRTVSANLHLFTMAQPGELSLDIPDDLSEIPEIRPISRNGVLATVDEITPASNQGQNSNNTAVVVAEPQSSAVMKFFGGVLTAARERMLGDTWWLASDITEIVEIPEKYLLAQHTVLERKEDFIILKGSYRCGTIYHVALIWKQDGKTYSIWRSELLAPVKDYVRNMIPFAILFKYIENIKDIKMLLAIIAKHPLWKPVHIAAKMDMQNFFQEAHLNGTLPALLNQSCQPEGRYPIHIVVINNYVELAKKLFSYGASVAQTDSKGQTALHYGARSSPAMLEVLCAHPEAKNCMNALTSDGYTPLLLAISGGKATCMAALLNRGAVLNVTCQGRSALHEAMLQNNPKVIDIIQTLIQACPAAITERDPVTGNSLLHIANNKRSLTALISVAPDIDRNVRNKVGQTALHWHVHRDDLGMVVALATLNADLDVVDNDGNTALHLAVSRGNIDIVKALLVLGSNVNMINIARDSPFHMAVKMKHKDKFDIIRCLITCGAQQCPADKQGCTVQCAYRPPGLPPRPPPPYSTLTDVAPSMASGKAEADSAKAIIQSISDPVLPKRSQSPADKDRADAKTGVRKEGHTVHLCPGVFAPTTSQLTYLDQFMHDRCVENMENLCKEKREDGIPKNHFETILTLDGGGIRGLVLVQTLLSLERELGEPLLNYVDWLAGTSTGAFMATALARGKSLRQCQHMYLSFKEDIFEGWLKPYSSEVLEKFLIVMCGPQTTMADIKKPKLIITTTAADKIPIKLHLFRNYQLPLNKEENEAMGYIDPESQILWKALRCSSAAPTYFSSVDSKFVDGGLAANNPTTEVLTEIQRYNNALQYAGKPEEERLRIGCVISIGTGLMPDVPSESLNFGGIESMSAVRTLGLMLIEQACATEGGPVERSRAWCQQMGAPLFRMNPLLSKDYLLDTKDDKEIVSMMWEAEEYAREMRDQFKKLASFLKTLKYSQDSMVSHSGKNAD